VRDVVARAVAQPDAVMAALGEPRRASINVLNRAPNLTVLNLVWGPGMTIMPHDHRMWAVMGIYTGREDNVFWRRLPPDACREIKAAGARALCRGDCTPLGADIVHSVTNPIPRLTGAGTQRVESGDAASGHTTCRRHGQLFEDSNRALAHA
jgi:predicted metal-dependent enzyme (double-stranded beta helix superfamily)